MVRGLSGKQGDQEAALSMLGGDTATQVESAKRVMDGRVQDLLLGVEGRVKGREYRAGGMLHIRMV